MNHSAITLRALAASPEPRARVGGKAHHLARLIAAGIPVPDGFVLPADLGNSEKRLNINYLQSLLGPLGPRLVVRSSAVLEDAASGAAPGLFASVRDVAPRDLDDAVRTVRSSADTAVVRGYARARGIAAADAAGALALAVIVQRQVGDAGAVRGTVYTRAAEPSPGGRSMWLEVLRGDQAWLAQIDRDTGAVRSSDDDLPLTREQLATLAGLARAAERAIAEAPAELDDAAESGGPGDSPGADVEWVLADGELWLVQARPIVRAPALRPPPPPALLAFSRAEPDVVWAWDAAHNPDPLSPAQAGLVERIDALGLAPSPMRVVGGYLYVGSRRPPPGQEPAAPCPSPGHEPAAPCPAPGHPVPALSADELTAAFEGRILPALDAALAPAWAEGATLAAALAGYEAFYRVYAAELTPLVDAARRRLPAVLRARVPGLRAPHAAEAAAGRLLAGGPPTPLEAALADAAAGRISLAQLVERVGFMAPAWDVAAPTFAETPELLARLVRAPDTARAVASAADPDQAPERAVAAVVEDVVRGGLGDVVGDGLGDGLGDAIDPSGGPAAGPAAHPEIARAVAAARAARDIGERDDPLFFRAQAAVRRALLAVARRWGLADPSDVFFMPLSFVARAEASGVAPCPAAVQRIADAGRAARARRRRWAMPLSFADGRPRAGPPRRGGELWRGRGTGGRAAGVVWRIDDLTGDVAKLPAPAAGAEAPPGAAGAGRVLVVSTITPAMAVLVRDAAAVVAEHGGVLGHGAAMARELGIPCVVDCAGAWSELREGDPVWIDADAGLVVRTRGLRVTGDAHLP